MRQINGSIQPISLFDLHLFKRKEGSYYVKADMQYLTFIIHSPYFICFRLCSIVSHLLLTAPSAPIHHGVSMFAQVLQHISNGGIYCSFEDIIWYS